MNKPPVLTKKCASCGIEKPMTAFLVLQTQVGAQYGNICANCRQKPVKQSVTPAQDIEDASGTSERHTIDNKAKVAIEKDRQQRFKETSIRDSEKMIEVEEEKNVLREKKSALSFEEKKHRETFLNTLSTSKPAAVRHEEKKRAERIKEQAIIQQHDHAQKEHEKTQQETNEIGFTNPLVGPTDRLKHQSTTFKQFLAWAGEGSVIAKNLTQLQNATTRKQNQPTTEPTVEELTKHISGPVRKK